MRENNNGAACGVRAIRITNAFKMADVIVIVISISAIAVVLASMARLRTVREHSALPAVELRCLDHINFFNGDIILVTGTSAIANLTQLALRSEVTHVGVVQVIEDVAYMCHVVPCGTRVTPLRAWIQLRQSKGDEVRVRHLSPPLPPFHLERASYSFGVWRALSTIWYPWVNLPGRDGKPHRMFCSQFVADVYSRSGVLDFAHHELTSSTVVPTDFSECGRALPWVQPYRLLSEVQINCYVNVEEGYNV
jgi:hypothetical protein